MGEAGRRGDGKTGMTVNTGEDGCMPMNWHYDVSSAECTLGALLVRRAERTHARTASGRFCQRMGVF